MRLSRYIRRLIKSELKKMQRTIDKGGGRTLKKDGMKAGGSNSSDKKGK